MAAASRRMERNCHARHVRCCTLQPTTTPTPPRGKHSHIRMMMVVVLMLMMIVRSAVAHVGARTRQKTNCDARTARARLTSSVQTAHLVSTFISRQRWSPLRSGPYDYRQTGAEIPHMLFTPAHLSCAVAHMTERVCCAHGPSHAQPRARNHHA